MFSIANAKQFARQGHQNLQDIFSGIRVCSNDLYDFSLRQLPESMGELQQGERQNHPA
jgi:hypothetical protein